MAKLCSVKQYVLLWYHGIIFHELNNTSMTIWVIWPLILRFEFSRHVYHLCFVYVASKLEADVSIHFSLQPEFISLLMVAINSLPRQDSTWIKVTINEKCRVVFYDQTSSDLIHLKRLKRMNTKTAPPPPTHTSCPCSRILLHFPWHETTRSDFTRPENIRCKHHQIMQYLVLSFFRALPL